jgi:hypothetical protein
MSVKSSVYNMTVGENVKNLLYYGTNVHLGLNVNFRHSAFSESNSGYKASFAFSF